MVWWAPITLSMCSWVFDTPPRKKRRTSNMPHCGKRKLLHTCMQVKIQFGVPAFSFPGCDYLDDVAQWCIAFASAATHFFVAGVKGAECRVSGSQDECQNGCLARNRCKFNQPLGCQAGNRSLLSSLGQQHVFRVFVQGGASSQLAGAIKIDWPNWWDDVPF